MPAVRTHRGSQFDGQQVDLGGKDEVVLREAAHGVGPDLDPNVPETRQVDLGMMAFLFGNLGHAIDEVDAGLEALHEPFFFQPQAVLADPPAGEQLEVIDRLLVRELLDPALARAALLQSETIRQFALTWQFLLLGRETESSPSLFAARAFPSTLHCRDIRLAVRSPAFRPITVAKTI